MLCKVTHCAGRVLANTNPHHLCCGDQEMGTAISCTKCSQMAGLSQKVSRSYSEVSSLRAAVLCLSFKDRSSRNCHVSIDAWANVNACVHVRIRKRWMVLVGLVLLYVRPLSPSPPLWLFKLFCLTVQAA